MSLSDELLNYGFVTSFMVTNMIEDKFSQDLGLSFPVHSLLERIEGCSLRDFWSDQNIFLTP